MSQTQVSESKKVEVIWSLTSICADLKIHERTFYRWLKIADIKPPSKKNAMIKAQDLDNFATLYVATKILGMTLKIYAQEVVPRSSISIPGLTSGKESDHLFGLETYYRQIFKRDLYQFLMMKIDPSQEEIPQFAQNIIQRLTSEHEYTRAS